VSGAYTECWECGELAPSGKVGASAILYHRGPDGKVVMTAAGHLAAREADKEEGPLDALVFQGRKAKADASTEITKQLSSKIAVQSITMTKVNLVSKLFGEKRGELWVSPKASKVTSGSTVVHSAGRYVGEFHVGRTQSFSCVREALNWLGHDTFLPGSPSIEDTMVFYYKLFTGKRAEKLAALAWDADNNDFVCYAWEDTKLNNTLFMMTVNTNGPTHRNSPGLRGP
jgi:ASC-1-like (ASCH) protein